MRIGLFTDTYHPAVNGISFVIDITRRGLEELGHEVYIFAPKPNVRYREDDPYIIRYTAIRGITWEEEMTSVFFPPLEVKRIKQLELDVIHFFTPDQVGLLGAYAAIKCGIPLVGQYCTDIYEYAKFYSGNIKALIDFPIGAPLLLKDLGRRWKKIVPMLGQPKSGELWRQRFLVQFLNALHEKCEIVIALSPKMYNRLLSWEPEYEIALLPTGVDPLPVTAKEVKALRKRLDIPDSSKVVLSVGRLGPEKNLELLIEAFALVHKTHPDTVLVIVGSNAYKPILEEIAEQLLPARAYRFTGAVKHRKLGAYYNIGDVFVFPSTTDTQGLVLNEAAGAGLPIVAIDRDVNEVMVEGKNTLFAKNRSADFAAKIIELLEDKQQLKRMSKRSQELAAGLTEDVQTERLEKLYQDAITHYRSRSARLHND